MAHGLDVTRMSSTYLIPGDQPSPGQLAARLDTVAERDLPRALGSILSALCSAEDPSVWLIPRLDVSLDVNGEWDADQLARAWAIELARALARALRAPDGRHAIRFADRAEYLAAFLGEAAEGSAWGGGRYEAFAGLRLLSASAAIRTVLIDPSEPGIRALGRLSAGTLQRVLAALSSTDAAVVVRQCLRLTACLPPRAILARAIAAWHADRRASSRVAGVDRRAVWWIARIAAAVDESNRPDETIAAVAAIVALDACLEAMPPAGSRALVEQVRHGGNIAMPDLPPFVPASHLRPWTTYPDLLEQATIGAIELSSGPPAAHRADSMTTAFGGVFWLLPLLDALPAEEWTDRPQLFRFVTFAGCCPPELRLDASRDGALRDLFGVLPEDTLDTVDAVARACVADWIRGEEHPAFDDPFDEDYFGPRNAAGLAAHAVVRLFAWKLAGFGRATARHLWMNCLNVSARLERHDQRIIVTMARPPLDVVLRLAGLSKTTYVAPRFDRRPFEIAAGD